jgi:hypothetical protein
LIFKAAAAITGGVLVEGAEGAALDGLATMTGFRGRTGATPGSGVSRTTFQSGTEASFRNPDRSPRRSISEAMMAGSILRC